MENKERFTSKTEVVYMDGQSVFYSQRLNSSDARHIAALLNTAYQAGVVAGKKEELEETIATLRGNLSDAKG